MKKLFTILTVVALATTTSFGQTQWGADLGLNFSNISGDDAADETSSRMGIRLGISADITLSDAVSLKTGALYSVKGVEIIMTDGYDNYNVSVSYNYLEIPLNLSFNVSDQFSLLVGPYIGYVVGSSINIDDSAYEAAYATEDLVADMDLGINLGAGISVSDAISINAGYQMGLTSLDPNGDADIFNSNILIGMTYSFGG